MQGEGGGDGEAMNAPVDDPVFNAGHAGVISRWLTRHFLLEQINGHEACPTYMYRWTLWHHKSGRAIMLHRFVADDWSVELHDHPKRFISVGLWGSYVEETPALVLPDMEFHFGGPVWLGGLRSRLWQAPWIRQFPATWRHRLRLVTGECWTLIYVGAAVRPWGFWHEPYGDGWHTPYFVNWELYVGDAALVDSVKSCP